MKTNSFPTYDVSENTTGCCPRFKPEGWDNRQLHFENKKFVRATTRSAMHIPWNMGSVFARVQGHIEEVDAADPATEIVLSHDLSAWEGEHFFAVTKDVPGEQMTTLSGDFFTRVFEGPYRNAKNFDHDIRVASKVLGKTAKDVFFLHDLSEMRQSISGKLYGWGRTRMTWPAPAVPPLQ